MPLPLANLLLLLGGVYLLLGLVFAGYFVMRGAARLDPVAAHGTWGFRLLILPGSVALWPLLLVRLLRNRRST